LLHSIWRTAAGAVCGPGELGWREESEGRQRPRKSQDWPHMGLRSGKILKLRGWVRRCPRRQGYICLPLKLCRARAEDPCGEGGNPTIRLRQSKPADELRHPHRCSVVERVRIEPSGPQALPDPKLASCRECRERGEFASVNPRRTDTAAALGYANVQSEPLKTMVGTRQHRNVCY
jgi:hypothetical protein